MDISKMKEKQEVLTKDDGLEIVSSERVTTLHVTGDLYGINDNASFFTGDHVFYTSTRLRALHPKRALQENSWIEVGAL